jgi:tetraacyldisaccharide 4'-kinase
MLESFLPEKAIFRTFYVSGIQQVVPRAEGKTDRTDGSLSTSATTSLRGRHVFPFSGLADNQDFLQTVADFECVVTGALKFPDHHPYSDRDLENVVQSAKRVKADCLVTTEKDYVRIDSRIAWPMDLAVVGIESAFGDDDQAFNAFLKSRLKELVKKIKNNHACSP